MTVTVGVLLPGAAVVAPPGPSGTVLYRLNGAREWLDARTTADAAGRIVLSGLSDGRHVLLCRAFDAFGVSDDTPAVLEFVVDTVAPVARVVLTNPPSDTVPSAAVEFLLASSEDRYQWSPSHTCPCTPALVRTHN